MIRQMIANCIKCLPYNFRATAQLLGFWPTKGISPSVPISYVGIDLAGPLIFEEQKNLHNCQVVVFICFAKMAIHLNLVRSLNTEGCLKALRRLIAGRGCLQHFLSDNGTNFIGASGDLIKFKRPVQEKHGDDSLPNTVMNLGKSWA